MQSQEALSEMQRWALNRLELQHDRHGDMEGSLIARAFYTCLLIPEIGLPVVLALGIGIGLALALLI